MDDPQRLRAAQFLRDQLQRLHRGSFTRAAERLAAPTCAAGEFQRLGSLLDKAVKRRHDAAAARLISRIGRAAFNLQRQLYDVSCVCSAHLPPQLPSLRELWQDLTQLESEFGRCEFSCGDAQLKVSTEDIELSGTYLGPFQIVLDLASLPRLEDRRPYRVVALDPQPSQRDSDTVHPHISDERLCEGDASNAIRSCLSTGRIAEFFLVVRSVLQTYNPSSAYVSLDDWDAASCSECGGSMNASERWCCERCRDEVCSDCIESCASCDDHHCTQCTLRCMQCEQHVCRDCAQSCSACGRRCCAGCLDEQLCGDCRERNDDEALAIPAVQPAAPLRPAEGTGAESTQKTAGPADPPAGRTQTT